MGGSTIWWCGRRLAPGQLQRQERHSQVAGTWRLQGIIVGISLPLLVLVATAAYGQVCSQPRLLRSLLSGVSSQRLLLTPALRTPSAALRTPSLSGGPGQRLLLTPSLSLGERYDDNIFETQTNKQDDFVTVLSPGIRAQYLSTEPTVGTQFDLVYRADAQFFADNSSQNDVAHRLFLTLESPLTPSLEVCVRNLLVVTEEQFGRDERLSDPTGLRPTSQQQRARTIRNEAEGRVDVRLGGRLSLGVLFGSLVEDVDVPQELDEFRYTVGTELGYVVNVVRDSSVFVGYQVTFESFRDNGIVPQGGGGASFQVHEISTGVRHALTPTLAANAELGYSFTSSDAPQNDDHSAVTADVGLIKTFHIGQASLRYVRRLRSGEGEGGAVIADTVSAATFINLTGKLTAGLGSNVSWFDFQGMTTGSLNRTNRRFWSVRPSLIYQPLLRWLAAVAYAYEYTDYTDSTLANITNHRLFLDTQFAIRDWLVLGLSYSYSARRLQGNITVGGDEFSRNQVMLTVTASPSLRF